ncbi:MAG: hypothetical protein WCC00_12365, partial [Candidatus Aminicenantales bacterium]
MCRSKIFCLGCVLVVTAFVSASASPKENPKKTPCQVISYNFLNAEIDTSKCGDLIIRNQHAVRLKVLNFNPFLYDLTINGQTVSYNQNFPTLLTAALTGNAPKPEEMASEVSAMAENLKVAKALQFEDREQAQNRIREYQDARKRFQATLSDVYLKLPTAETIVLESVGFSDDLTKEKILSQIKQRQITLCNADNPDTLRDMLSPVIDRPRPAWADLNDAFRDLADDAKKLFQDDFDAEKSRWLVFQ